MQIFLQYSIKEQIIDHQNYLSELFLRTVASGKTSALIVTQPPYEITNGCVICLFVIP